VFFLAQCKCANNAARHYSISNPDGTAGIQVCLHTEKDSYRKFSVPRGLEKAVDFWIKIYAEFDTEQFVLHDTDNYVIYEVVDVSDVESIPYFSEKIKDEIIDSKITRAEKKYRDALMVLNSMQQKGINPAELDPFLLKLYKGFENVKNPDKYLLAARMNRIRSQRGQHSAFKRAMYYSRRYLPVMEEIFRRHKLPTELTRIPFVESYFNPRAVSFRSASGIWQFMRDAAKRYLKVHENYDERNDPVISTFAAAKHLKNNYDMLKSWPLAVTAYNHGHNGIARAVKQTGTTDLPELIQLYKSETFGFASKNFYAEFLAALYVEKNYEKFFPDVDFAKTLKTAMIVTMKPMSISELEALLDVSRDNLQYYNPALSKSIFQGKAVVPKGARVRMPYTSYKSLLGRAGAVKVLTEYVRFLDG
jgi:membrane-bound lytic murein transglycosylase D